MTLPLRVQLPQINHEAFEAALRESQHLTNGLDIRTRAEVRLEATREDLAALQAESEEIAAELVASNSYLTQIQTIITTLERHAADNAIERNALLQQLHALQQSGVVERRPKNDVQRGSSSSEGTGEQS